MKNKKRALRRHHKQRMRERARYIGHSVYRSDRYYHGDLETWYLHQVIKRADNFCVCSCAGCGNQRHSLWGGIPHSEKKMALREFDYDEE